MKLITHIAPTRFLAQVLFIIVPTALAVGFLLHSANHYFTILREQWFMQTIYFTIGITTATLVYTFRFRFLPSFGILVFVLYSIYKMLDKLSIGEFDSFFISVQFLVFSYLFCIGWLMGWLFQRIKFAPVIISAIMVLLCLFVISKSGETNIITWLSFLLPTLLYSVYIIYTHEQLKNTEKTDGRFWFNFFKRLLLFCIIASMFIGISIAYYYKEIEEKVANFGGGGKPGEGMLKQEKDGTVSNNTSMGMNSQNKRTNELVFCAHINNNFPGTDIPNPLYLTNSYYTKFDTLTETFETDTKIPSNDLFSPDVSKIPLFFTKSDSSVLTNSLSKKNKHIVEIEVYKKKLSPKTFLAPSTAFFVQPITVEKDFQLEYYSAYRAKSYVSELNSAYFIYNTDDAQIAAFQKQRFETLRKAKDYSSTQEDFLHYYTYFPNAKKYNAIQVLADSLAKDKTTTIDKVLAIRDYFLERNAMGNRIFSYTDNPGIPGLPGASKLLNFLFETKKGYCAYYSGATLFMLRAMKIPSRIVTGFLTVDRSDKNKGWYFYYADQSHAWVQVYFPEYGWIDFDTTVGNEDAQQSPTPDGTPPMQPPKALLAASGTIISTDTIKKTIQYHLTNLLFLDKEYPSLNIDITLNAKNASIFKDSTLIPISKLQKGYIGMAISYDEQLKKYSIERNAEDVLKKLSKEIPVDEIYVRENKPDEFSKKETTLDIQKNTWLQILLKCLAILAIITIIVLACPSLIYRYYKYKINNAKNNSSKAYYMYKASTFILNQIGYKRANETNLQFASNTVDAIFDTNYTKFMSIYLKIKFANQKLNEAEIDFISNYYPAFEKNIKSQTNKLPQKFLNIPDTIHYFITKEQD